LAFISVYIYDEQGLKRILARR